MRDQKHIDTMARDAAKRLAADRRKQWKFLEAHRPLTFWERVDRWLGYDAPYPHDRETPGNCKICQASLAARRTGDAN